MCTKVYSNWLRPLLWIVKPSPVEKFCKVQTKICKTSKKFIHFKNNFKGNRTTHSKKENWRDQKKMAKNSELLWKLCKNFAKKLVNLKVFGSFYDVVSDIFLDQLRQNWLVGQLLQVLTHFLRIFIQKLQSLSFVFSRCSLASWSWRGPPVDVCSSCERSGIKNCQTKKLMDILKN